MIRRYLLQMKWRPLTDFAIKIFLPGQNLQKPVYMYSSNNCVIYAYNYAERNIRSHEERASRRNYFTIIVHLIIPSHTGLVANITAAIIYDSYTHLIIIPFVLWFQLDGWIARNWKGQSTKMGSFLDPMADKVLIATLFISLTWQNLIPLPLTLLIVGRDVALVISAFVIRYMSLPPPVRILISLSYYRKFSSAWVICKIKVQITYVLGSHFKCCYYIILIVKFYDYDNFVRKLLQNLWGYDVLMDDKKRLNCYQVH